MKIYVMMTICAIKTEMMIDTDRDGRKLVFLVR